MTEPATPDPTPAPTPEVSPTEPQQQNVDSLPQWARDAISKANTEAARYRTQVRDLEPKAQQYDALEEASKTETQRLQEANAKSARDAESAQSEALRLRIAIRHGINADDLDLLGSGTEEEVTARAERVAALHAAAATPPTVPPPARNAPALPGATPPPPPAVDDVEARYRTYFPARN